MNDRIGVCIVGSNGAVATTVVAGVALMNKGIAPRRGMITERLAEVLDLAPLEGLVFAGWDLREGDAYEAAIHHAVVQRHLLDAVKEELTALRPWPAAVSSRFLHSMSGQNVVTARSAREEIKILERNILDFKAEKKLDRVVVVNLTSTERSG